MTGNGESWFYDELSRAVMKRAVQSPVVCTYSCSPSLSVLYTCLLNQHFCVSCQYLSALANIPTYSSNSWCSHRSPDHRPQTLRGTNRRIYTGEYTNYLFLLRVNEYGCNSYCIFVSKSIIAVLFLCSDGLYFLIFISACFSFHCKFNISLYLW